MKIVKPFLIILVLAAIAIVIIFYGRGYRLDLEKRTIGTKGLLVASSRPDGAQVFINGKLTTATNTTLTLDPGWYTVRLEKEGYSAWEKKMRVQGEVVAKTDAILFPINPSLSPITVTGVVNPSLSPDANKIVFTVSKVNNLVQKKGEDGGVFILDLNDRPLGATRDFRQIARNSPSLSFENASFSWDPTGKQILAKVNNRYFLLDAQALNSNPTEVTAVLDTVYQEWTKETETLQNERYSAIKGDLASLLKSSVRIIAWSPDETKILYEATSSATIPQIIKPPLIGTNPTKEERELKSGRIYVYDIKEDKNFFIMEKNKIKGHLQWFPTSSHLLLTEEGKISVMDYDATNRVTLYAGPFIGDFVAPWPNGSKIVILTTLNPQPDAKPNLYAINIR